jgi:hypothetical protein
LFFSRAIWLTASPTEEVGTSMIRSTPWSYHCRAMFAPTSGRFWWSASATSTVKPWLAPNSATASRTAATEVGPVLSR